MDPTATLNQAIIAAKAGRNSEARRLLEIVLDADERNEQAWLWMSSVVDSEEERSICLENVLTINPRNEKARTVLAALVSDRPASSPTSRGLEKASPAAGGLQASASQSAPHTGESGAGGAPTGQPSKGDSRAFIVITIALALILVCTVVSILAYVILSPTG